MTSAALARIRARADVVALALLLSVASVIYYVIGRGLGFFYDEWDFVLKRRGNSVDTFLDSHGGHFSLIPVLIYKALWATVGMRHYGPYRLTVLALHLVCVALVFVLVRRRIGGALGLIGATSLLFLGPAWQDLIWPFQIGFVGSVAAGLGALIVVERNTRYGDVAASLLLAVSLSCSGLGLPFLAGTTIAILINKRSWLRLWIVIGPALAYSAWYLRYGENAANGGNVSAVPGYVFESLAGALSAVFAVDTQTGKWLAGIALIGLTVSVLLGRATLQVLPFATIALSFWVLTGLSRAQLHEPAASRYLYVGAVALILISAELARGLRVPPGVIAALGIAVLVTSSYNLRTLRAAAAGLRANAEAVNAELAVIELEHSVVKPDFRPDVARAPQITAGPYLAAVRDLGSPALSPSVLAAQTPSLRLDVDRVLMQAVKHVLVSRARVGTAARAAPEPETHEAGVISRSGRCLTFHPTRGNVTPSLELVIPRNGLVVESHRYVQIFMRRLSDAYASNPLMKLTYPRSVIRPPKDALNLRWHIRVVPSGTLTVCSAA